MEENALASKRDQMTLKAVMVILIAYNLLFFVSEFFPSIVPDPLMKVYGFVLKHRLMIGFLEFIGITVLFIDLIVAYDKKKGWNKTLTLLFTALLMLAFFLKIFMTYLRAFQETGAQG